MGKWMDDEWQMNDKWIIQAVNNLTELNKKKWNEKSFEESLKLAVPVLLGRDGTQAVQVNYTASRTPPAPSIDFYLKGFQKGKTTIQV